VNEISWPAQQHLHSPAMYRGVINDNAAFLHYFFNVTKTQRVCHVPSHTKHHDFQRIMQSFKNLAEGTFDEAFAKIVHTKLYQIRLLRHNLFGSSY
jgi:hypothetical protein